MSCRAGSTRKLVRTKLGNSDLKTVLETIDAAGLIAASEKDAQGSLDDLAKAFTSAATLASNSLPDAVGVASLYGVLDSVFFQVPIGASNIDRLYAASNLLAR